MNAKAYTASDGELVLTQEPAAEGGYVVTSPFDPELITEAESVEEAFADAHDSGCHALTPPLSTDHRHPMDLAAGEHERVVQHPACSPAAGEPW